MDMIENLAKQASQITMYDIKSYYNSAKNTILNVPEMEAKVREATNDDAWGASSTLMQQISEGTHNYNEFNIIMPCIYSRFMEKEAREWRQIYKALTLLEFLVKNGSERVVDDARAHISTIKMLRSFHYIDEKGKDQGINVRNRASEIATLLGDVDQIRRERRKAKANRSKYQGHEGGGGGGGMSFMTAGGSRYGGFGSDSINNGGGGSGGGGYEAGDDYRRRDYNSSSRQGGANEYDEYEGADDFDDRAVRRTGSSSTGNSRPASRPQVPSKSPSADVPPPKAKAVEKKPEVNLFDFDDDPIPAPAPAPAAAPILGGDDDFDDFQTAPTAASAASAPAPAPVARPQANNAGLFDLLNTGAPAKPTAAPSYSSPVRSNGMGMQAPLSAAPASAARPNYTSSTSTAGPMSPPLSSPPAVGGGAKASGSAFDDLWTSSLSATASAPKPTPAGGVPGKTIKDLENQRAMDKLWGNTQRSQSQGQGQGQQKAAGGGQFDDLLF